MNFRRMLIVGMCWLLPVAASVADDAATRLTYQIEENIAYYDAAALSRADAYQEEHSKLDVISRLTTDSNHGRRPTQRCCRRNYIS